MNFILGLKKCLKNLSTKLFLLKKLLIYNKLKSNTF